MSNNFIDFLKKPSGVFSGSSTFMFPKGNYNPSFINQFANLTFYIIDENNKFTSLIMPNSIKYKFLSSEESNYFREELKDNKFLRTICSTETTGLEVSYIQEQIGKSGIITIIAYDEEMKDIKGFTLLDFETNNIIIPIICANKSGKLMLSFIQSLCHLNNLPNIKLYATGQNQFFYLKSNFDVIGHRSIGMDGTPMEYSILKTTKQPPIIYGGKKRQKKTKKIKTKKMKTKKIKTRY